MQEATLEMEIDDPPPMTPLKSMRRLLGMTVHLQAADSWGARWSRLPKEVTSTWSAVEDLPYQRMCRERQYGFLKRAAKKIVPPPPNVQPWLVFAAGPTGVGKSCALRTLKGCGSFPLDDFQRIDPDRLSKVGALLELGEYLTQKGHAEVAQTQIRRESTNISEMLFDDSLQRGVNILVVGSLHDYAWYKQLFATLREHASSYRIAILHISADATTVRLCAGRS